MRPFLQFLAIFYLPQFTVFEKKPQKVSFYIRDYFLKHIWEIIFKKKIVFNIFGLNLIFRKIDFFENRMKNQSTGNVYLMQWHINLDFAFAALENFRNVKTWAEKEDAQALFSKSSEKKKTKKSDPRLQ